MENLITAGVSLGRQTTERLERLTLDMATEDEVWGDEASTTIRRLTETAHCEAGPVFNRMIDCVEEWLWQVFAGAEDAPWLERSFVTRTRYWKDGSGMERLTVRAFTCLIVDGARRVAVEETVYERNDGAWISIEDGRVRRFVERPSTERVAEARLLPLFVEELLLRRAEFRRAEA